MASRLNLDQWWRIDYNKCDIMPKAPKDAVSIGRRDTDGRSKSR